MGAGSVADGPNSGLSWPAVPAQMEAQLDAQGWAVLPGLLSPASCAGFRDCYARAPLFRQEIVMAPRGYGRGTYKYFAYPLPDPIGPLRAGLYPQLLPTNRRWGAGLILLIYFASPGIFKNPRGTALFRCPIK